MYYKAFFMAYTGVDLYNDLQVRTNQGQAGAFLNIDRANYVVNSAIINQFEKVVSQLAIQRNTDEVSPCVKRDVPYTPYNSKVLLKPLAVASAKVTIVDTYIEITFDRPHNLPLSFFHLGLSLDYPLVINGVNGLMETGQDASLNKKWTQDITYVNNYTIQVDVQGTGYSTKPANTTVIGLGQMTSEAWVSDYYHLLAIQYQSKVNLGLSILDKVTNSNLTILTIPSNNNIRTGEYLYMSGGIVDEDVFVYVEKVAYNKIKLYGDAKLKYPITNANTQWYLPNWSIYRMYSRYADPLNPDQKVDVYRSNFYYPLYQSSDNNLSVEVYDKHKRIDTNVTPTSFVVDYVRTFPPIDLENNTYDIHQDFNAKFCDKIIEYAALKFQAFTSATEDAQLTEIIGGAH